MLHYRHIKIFESPYRHHPPRLWTIFYKADISMEVYLILKDQRICSANLRPSIEYVLITTEYDRIIVIASLLLLV
jgi:hypothetical protein